LLGALADFREEERVGVDALPELERYILHLTAELDAKLRQAVNDFDFNTYVRALTDFANEDLSAFYFDIRKDVLYCEINAETGEQTDKRRANRTVLDILYHALVRWLAPVLVFTSEEVWGTRYPEAGSVHLLEWPELPLTRHPRGSGGPALPEEQRDSRLRGNDEWMAKWKRLRELRELVIENIEPMRREKKLGSSLEARVTVRSADAQGLAAMQSVDFGELCIVSDMTVDTQLAEVDSVVVERTAFHKCGRCWRHMPEVRSDGDLCDRCEGVLNG
jgi:isoleucyl-tRNA synthetase